jgi:hypothetical protein
MAVPTFAKPSHAIDFEVLSMEEGHPAQRTSAKRYIFPAPLL